MKIKEIRLLPPLAIARLGSSPEPMVNYELEEVDAVSPRRIVPAPSLQLDAEGNVSEVPCEDPVRFRDSHGLIRPVAPFFEVWAQREGAKELEPLTIHLLKECGLAADAVQWSLHLGNHKIHRRTNNPDDCIEAKLGPIRDHARHAVEGVCEHFIKGEKLPLGWFQVAKPGDAYPEIRARYTPAGGKVYGSSLRSDDPNVVHPLYDGSRGKWTDYSEPDNPPNTFEGRRLTNPGEIFAGYGQPDETHWSYGYVDDECDGIVEVTLTIDGKDLTAFARMAAGPPTFAPDSKPVRTVADELEQALHGPDVVATEEDVRVVKDIVRRALETVRLMNTTQMNKAGKTRGVGMARMDYLDYSRALDPIFEPEVTDSLAIRARHERVVLALESGSLAWFGRVLRDYDQVGDLSDDGRRKMPAMMRNADGRHLALTRRQVAKVRKTAEYIISRGADRGEAPASREVRPVNRSAQLQYRGRGNPPNTHPDTAISNAYPGLEMDFRNAWRRIFEGLVLHESLNLVLEAEAPYAHLAECFLLKVEGIDMTAPVTVTDAAGKTQPLKDTYGNDRMALEWSNALAKILHSHQGKEVTCEFEGFDEKRHTAKLKLRHFFEPGTAVIARDVAEPGALSQSLCAPWQNDYRECACFYWAASRPDFVNVELGPDGKTIGHQWMQKDRTAKTAKVYINDDWMDERLYSHTDIVRDWEKVLRFIIANQDEPPIPT